MALALLPDLEERSVLDVVEENFQKLGLKSCAVRYIYAGEHTLPKQEMISHFCKWINAVNGGYCDVNVSGLLLVYDSYFVNMIEGSEDTVYRLLRFMFQGEKDWVIQTDTDEEAAYHAALEAALAAIAQAEEEGLRVNVELPEPWVKPLDRKMFKKMKILMIYHSVQTRLFQGFRTVTARPPSLVGKLDIFGPLPEHMEQLKVCLDKLTKLCNLVKNDKKLSTFEGLSANDPKMDALPEVALIDYLLQSQYILDLRSVLHQFRRVDDHLYYFEKVWPLTTHFTPRYLYKLKVDDSFVEPLPVMPWELIKKEVKEEEEGLMEDHKSSSSSD